MNPASSLKGEPHPAAHEKTGAGRPPKYGKPSRPITVTLPESTLEGLERIDPDRGHAIVKLTEAALRPAASAAPQVEIVEMAANIGLLVISKCKALRRIPFLHLVEVAPGRYLLALDPGNDFHNLELAIHDIMEDVPQKDTAERELMRQLLEKIKRVRKAERVSMAEILFVNLDGARKAAAAPASQG